MFKRACVKLNAILRRPAVRLLRRHRTRARVVPGPQALHPLLYEFVQVPLRRGLGRGR